LAEKPSDEPMNSYYFQSAAPPRAWMVSDLPLSWISDLHDVAAVGEEIKPYFVWGANVRQQRRLTRFDEHAEFGGEIGVLEGMDRDRAAQPLNPPALRITVGKAIATGCLNCQSSLEWQFVCSGPTRKPEF
jgi:hypothetical protein